MTIPDESVIRWFKSSHSSTQGCIEVAQNDDSVLVRDSKDPEGVKLRVSRDNWRAFVRGVRDELRPRSRVSPRGA